MDRRARRAIDSAMDAIAGDAGGGRVHLDTLAAAVYRLEPPGSECMIVACHGCRQVTVKPGTPRLPELTIRCSGCGAPLELRPPAEVVAFGRFAILPVPAGRLPS